MSEPIVTVVVSVREGHVMAERSLASVLADDVIPFDLIYIDTLSPPRIAAAIAAQCQARGFRLIRHDDWIAPSAARKQALPLIATKYVAFVDNDVLVERGALAKLVACAEETGAGLTSPLYLEADGAGGIKVHMAGGLFTWSDDGVLVAEGHWLHGAPVEAARDMTRHKVDYTEYHYVVGRRDFLAQPDAIADDVLLVNEHIDLALFARQQGLAVFLEPSAKITYTAPCARTLMDADFYRRRWNAQDCDADLTAFARRWPFADREAVVEPVRVYAGYRLLEFDVRRVGSSGQDLAEIMTRGELAQTRYALREQAFERGYGEAEVQALEQTCDFATLAFDGLYRPDGRPFLNHVIGTASALVRYELRMDIVLAGLAHAAYTHRPVWLSEDDVARTLRARGRTDALVRAHPLARSIVNKGGHDPNMFTVADAEVLCILAANEIDMQLSGEYRATGRPPELTVNGQAAIICALGHVGVDGLAASASQPIDNAQPWPLFGAGARQVSFRLDAANRRLVSV